MSVAIVLLAALLLVAAIAGAPRWRTWRRQAWASRPFPQAWRTILRRRVPLYRQLPADLQQQLRQRILVFLAEKPFLGCAGLEITDEMRVTIAAQACLLRLNRGDAMFAELKQILVYPGAFLVDRVHAAPGGVLREQRRALAGESWSQGQVILSWQDVLDGARVVDDGHNVVLHEFAHQLDQETGNANGAPRLGSRAAHARWAQVMGAEFAALQARIRAREAAQARAQAGWSWFEASADGLSTAEPADLISDYGATNEAEFFAVVTEVYFEQADALALRHPALFALLRDYYAVDPRHWR
ncbi:MAG: M90 family metallopeptidase [Burkholderiaceae bacterium]|jgi:Mlc titration factor MtfA (ptsG expression regulator)